MHKGISVSSPQNLKDSKSWETNYLKQVAKKIKALDQSNTMEKIIT